MKGYLVVPLRCLYGPFLLGTSLFLLASAFFGWLAATDAYPVLDLLTAGLARTASTGLAHRNLLHYKVVVSGSTLLPLVAADEIVVFLLGFVLGISIFLLQKPQEFLLISFHLGEVVVGEFAPLLFDSPFDFLPFPFQNIFIHVRPPFLLFAETGTQGCPAEIHLSPRQGPSAGKHSLVATGPFGLDPRREGGGWRPPYPMRRVSV